MTKEECLKEIPRKRRGDIVVTWDEFKDLERIIKSQVIPPKDLEMFKREIVARRESMGLVPGLNKRKKVDGEFVYVSAS